MGIPVQNVHYDAIGHGRNVRECEAAPRRRAGATALHDELRAADGTMIDLNCRCIRQDDTVTDDTVDGTIEPHNLFEHRVHSNPDIFIE